MRHARERGSRGGLCSIDDLPRVRETELRTPMNAIGVDEGDVHFLSYEDRKLAQAPLEEYAARDGQAHSPASSAGGEFRPVGDERHPDHVAMSRLKSDVIAAADSRWYPEAVHGYPELTMNEEAFRLAWGPRPAGIPVETCSRDWSESSAPLLLFVSPYLSQVP